MKNLIMTFILCTTLAGSAYAGSYCERTMDKPEVFRIGVPRAQYKPQPSDCEVIHKGDEKAIHTCRVARCDTFMQSGH